MSACAGMIQSLGTFGWWAGYFSHQNGGDLVYFKDTFNQSRVREEGHMAKDEDYFPPRVDWHCGRIFGPPREVCSRAEW